MPSLFSYNFQHFQLFLSALHHSIFTLNLHQAMNLFQQKIEEDNNDRELY